MLDRCRRATFTGFTYWANMHPTTIAAVRKLAATTAYPRRMQHYNAVLSAPWHARRYESIIATLCENLDTLDEPEAKASMIWIIGEYAERIDNADELLEQFLETFPEEQSMVRG